MPKIFWVGLGLLGLGSGPLVLIAGLAAVGIGDPEPNPVGPGLLAFVTFWPACIMLVLGLILRFRRQRPS